MSDPINANPTVLDASSLPTRLENKEKDPNVQLVQQITALSLRPKWTANPDNDVSLPQLVSDNSDSEDEEDLVDSQEVFDLISTISDPEHPLTLGQLAVVNLSDIDVIHGNSRAELLEVVIRITPTITHCSLATLIGLGIRVRLERCLPPRFRIRILVKEGTHQSEKQVNKQLNDKERVAAACENDQLLLVILTMLSSCK